MALAASRPEVRPGGAHPSTGGRPSGAPARARYPRVLREATISLVLLASRDLELILDLVAAFEDAGHTVLRVDDVPAAIDHVGPALDALVASDDGDGFASEVRRWRRRSDSALVILAASSTNARLARETGGAYFQRPTSQPRSRRSAVGGDTVPDALWAPALVRVAEAEIERRQRPSAVPVVDSDEPPSVQPRKRQPSGERVERDILVVDDDPHIRQAIGDLLEAEGYTIAQAHNGLEALALLRGKLAPRMILLDLMMPDMDGWELRAELDKDPTLCHIPVAIVSAFVPFDRVTALQVEAVFKKPFDVPHLLGTIERLIG